MPGPNYVLDKGYVADTAVPLFYVVKQAATKEHCTINSAAGEPILGVAQEAVLAGTADVGKRVIDIRMKGISRCVAAVAIGIGQYVRAAGDGRVTTLAATTANQNIVGKTTTASAAAGDHIDVDLMIGVQIST